MLAVERASALSAFREALAAGDDGNGSVLVVKGASGLGKTYLLGCFEELACGEGRNVLYAAGSAAEQGHAWGVLGQLLWSQAPPAAAGDTGATGLEAAPVAGGSAVWHLADLTAALAARAEGRPLVLIVDDAHLADDESLHLLTLLGRQVRRTPCVVVLGWSAAGAGRPDRAALEAHPRCRTLRLGTLSPSGVRCVLGGRPEPGAEDLQAAAVHAMTGGHPALVRAVTADAAVVGRPPGRPDEAAYGPRFREAVLTCLSRSGPEVVAAASVLAALAEAATPERLAGLVSAVSVVHLLDLFREMGFTRLGVMQPAIRTAVLDTLSASERRDLFTHIGVTLQGQGEPPDVVARFLLSAGGPAPSWAVGVLTDAAAQATEPLDVTFRANCLELAYESCQDDACRAQLIRRMADLAWTGDLHRMDVLLDRMEGLTRAGLLPRGDLPAVIGHLLWYRSMEQLDDLFGQLAADPPSGSPDLDVLRSRLASTFPTLHQAFAEAIRRPDGGQVVARDRRAECGLGVDSTVPVAESSIELRRRAEGALATVLSCGPGGAAVREAETVLQMSRISDSSQIAVSIALRALLYGDRPDVAESWVAQHLSAGRHRLGTAGAALLEAVRAEIAYRQGDLHEACTRAEEALELLSPREWGMALGTPLATLVRASLACGRCDQAEDLLRMAVPAGMFATRHGLEYLFARSDYFMALGQPRPALEDLLRCGHLMHRWSLDQPAFLPWRAAAATVLAQLADREQARRLADEELHLTGRAGRRSRGVALRAVAGTMDPRERIPLLREAVEILDGSQARYELARVHVDLCRAHTELDEPAAARSAARQAIVIGTSCKAQRALDELVQLVDEPLSALAVENAGPAVLSEAERRVALLAADGCTNRTIAQRLFITVSTVEQHLTRVYRKVQVNDRRALSKEPWYSLLNAPSGRVASADVP